MNMIGHTINRKSFMVVILYNGSYIFIKFLFPGKLNEIIPTLYGIKKLNIQLCVRITHGL